MVKFKRLLALGMSFTLAIGALVGCGGKDASSSNGGGSSDLQGKKYIYV